MPTEKSLLNYAILASYQAEELERLLKNLLFYNKVEKEDIIIAVDSDTATAEVRQIIERYEISSYDNPLNKDFAQQRNFLKSKCINPYIFYLDCDEIPNYLLVQNLPKILEANPTTEILGVPRLNLIDFDIDVDLIDQPFLQTDQLGRVQFPDFQFRVIKNDEKISWEGKLHEIPVGGEVFLLEPSMANCIIHEKTASSQLKRESFYSTIKNV